MGATSIYALPWPELPDPANAPDGFTRLAGKVDDQMTQWRSENSRWADIGQTIGSGATAIIWTNQYNAIKGWMELDVYITMASSVDGCAAATVNALIGGTLVRSWYLHNDCMNIQPFLVAAGSGAREFTSATPNVVCQIEVRVDSLGVPIQVYTYNVMARQFGSLT